MDYQVHQVTRLLQAWSEGDPGALDQLMPLVYDHLHQLAQRYMAQERPGHTLQATALVHEAYLRLLESARPSWQDKTHFFALCARMMRRILVDWARSRQTLKRGSAATPLALEEAVAVVGDGGMDLVAVDDALTALAAVDPRKSQLVELRFFGGLSLKEAAHLLNVSEETAQRDWKLSKIWLRRELNKGKEMSRGA